MALLVLGALFVRAGFWQANRAHEARGTIHSFAEAKTAPPYTALPGRVTSTLRYRRVSLRGHYVPERQFLIDNIPHDGQVGYDVLTPFKSSTTGRWLIVNRGWVAASPYRTVLPDVTVSAGERTIDGRFAALPSPGLRLGQPPANVAKPVMVLAYPSVERLSKRLGEKLFPYAVNLDAAAADGFKRQWTAPVVMSPARHWGYAAQWWGFALIAWGAAGTMLVRSVARRNQ